MSAAPRVLIPAKLAENAQTTQYTSPAAGQGTLIDKLTATNVSGATAVISINLVSDGAPSDNDLIVKTKSLLAGETYTFPEIVGAYLAPGSTISTLAGTASAINIRASGRELT